MVRRDRFDTWLFERAAATANVDARMGAPFRYNGERFVVGADGRRSLFHRRLTAHAPLRRRVGLSTHVSGIEGVVDRVEVFFHADGELYVAPTGGGETLVAALFYRERFRRDGLMHLLNAIPELRDRAQQVRLTMPVLAAAPLRLHVPRVVDRELLSSSVTRPVPRPITETAWHGFAPRARRPTRSYPVTSARTNGRAWPWGARLIARRLLRASRAETGR